MPKKQQPKVPKKHTHRTPEQVKRHHASRLIKDLVSVYVFTGDQSRTRLFNRRTFKEVPVTAAMDSALKDHPYRWSISNALLLREKNGKKKLYGEEVCAFAGDDVARIKYADLEPAISESHANMVSSYVHKGLIVTVGWAADRDLNSNKLNL